MKRCISQPDKECTNSSCGMLRWCANQGKSEVQSEQPIKCGCEVCEMGIPTPMSEWLQNPVHKQIHERIMRGLKRGEIQVKGEENEAT